MSKEEKLRADRAALLKSLRDYHASKGNNSGWKPEALKELWNVITVINDNRLYDFLSFSQQIPGHVTYAKSPEFKFINKRRTRTTLGKYIRRQLKTIVPLKIMMDGHLHGLTRFVSSMNINHDEFIGVLYGYDIQDAYRSRVGGQSCMTGSDSELVELYAINPKKIGLAVYKMDHGKSARALLWHTDEGETILDNPYGACEPADGLQTWAERKGYLIFDGHGTNNPAYLKAWHVTLKSRGLNNYPYLDHFNWGSFLDTREDTLCLSNQEEQHLHHFNDTDGTYYTYKRCSCCHLGRASMADLNGRTVLCSKCYKEKSYERCARCGKTVEGGGLTKFRNAEEWAGGWCNQCATNHLKYCNKCDMGYIFQRTPGGISKCPCEKERVRTR